MVGGNDTMSAMRAIVLCPSSGIAEVQRSRWYGVPDVLEIVQGRLYLLTGVGVRDYLICLKSRVGNTFKKLHGRIMVASN